MPRLIQVYEMFLFLISICRITVPPGGGAGRLEKVLSNMKRFEYHFFPRILFQSITPRS